MRREWWLVLIVLVITVVVVRTQRPDKCVVTWHLGAIDRRFNINELDVLTAADSAAKLWDGAAHRRLFRYRRSEGIPIQLIYDERQTAVNVDREERQRMMELDAQIQSLKKQFAVTPSQDLIDRVNAAVVRYNSLVAKYNGRGTREGEQGSFEKVVEKRGSHIVREKPKQISIYQFQDLTDLELVIAHEFGHALGIEHVSDVGAVMSATHTFGDIASAPRLHEADLAALRSRCP